MGTSSETGQADGLPLFLALDQGGHSTRAIVYDANGEALLRARAEVDDSSPREGWVEQDAEALVQSLLDVLDDIARQLGADTGRLVSAGLATQRSNVVCWDHQTGRALTTAISWQDRRASTWIRQFDEQSEQIHAITGLYLSPHYGVGKLHWCLAHSNAVKKALEEGRLACGPLASFLAWRLLDDRPYCVDPANAARTLLWNLDQKCWDHGLREMFGIPRSLLPDCVETVHTFGSLAVGGKTVPFRCVTGDQSAALFVEGLPDPANIFVNIGTGAFVQRSTGNNVVRRKGLLSGIAHYAEGRATYTLEGTVNGAGSAMDWLSEMQPQSFDFKDLDALLATDREVSLFLNGVAGLGAPWWVPDFPSQFLGEGSAGDKAVAVIESMVFLITVNLDLMRAIDPAVKCVVVTGGFAALDGLCQRLADLNGVVVRRPREHEATARGLGWLLSESDDRWELEDVKRFQPRGNSNLAGRFQRWKKAMDAVLAGLQKETN